jgi:hypothetical protein
MGWSSNPNERICLHTKPESGKFRVKERWKRRVACHLSLYRKLRQINEAGHFRHSRGVPAGLRLFFRLFSLGRTAAITDNVMIDMRSQKSSVFW